MWLRWALVALLTQASTQGLVVPVLAPPTKTAPPTSPAETADIRVGIALFDQGKTQDAIAKFEEILKAHPDSPIALYELGMSYHVAGQYQRAIDALAAAATYDVPKPQLAQYYGMIGNTLDMAREPRKAIEVYTKGLEIAPSAPLYYNMAVTYAQSLTDVPNAKAALKKGARYDPWHASTQLQLGRLFAMDELATPALLAFSRFLIIEPASARTGDAYQMWFNLLNGGFKPGADGKAATINVNPTTKKDEGEIIKLDMLISLSRATSGMGPEQKTQIQMMADQLKNLFAVYAAQSAGDDKDTFLWTYYMPFVAEMHKKDFVEPFVYFISQRTNLPGVREWLTINRERVNAFLQWARAFPFPKPSAP